MGQGHNFETLQQTAALDLMVLRVADQLSMQGRQALTRFRDQTLEFFFSAVSSLGSDLRICPKPSLAAC